MYFVSIGIMILVDTLKYQRRLTHGKRAFQCARHINLYWHTERDPIDTGSGGGCVSNYVFNHVPRWSAACRLEGDKNLIPYPHRDTKP